TRRLVESHAAKLHELRQEFDKETKEKLDRFDAIQRQEAEDRERRQKEKTRRGLMSAIQYRLSPARAARREAKLRREQAQFEEKQKQEHDAYAATVEQIRALEIENLTERQGQHLRDRATRVEEDLER